MKKRVIDPPAGWQYGFPKFAPDNYETMSKEERVQWFLDQGYPQFEIDLGSLKYCRSWFVDPSN